jgi:hypothetical protein
MNLLFPQLMPLDIQNIILEYTGFHKLRNGKYMTQLTPKRLKEMNRKIRRMPQKTNGYVCLKMSKTITEIIIGPSFYYSELSGRL